MRSARQVRAPNNLHHPDGLVGAMRWLLIPPHIPRYGGVVTFSMHAVGSFGVTSLRHADISRWFTTFNSITNRMQVAVTRRYGRAAVGRLLTLPRSRCEARVGRVTLT